MQSEKREALMLIAYGLSTLGIAMMVGAGANYLLDPTPEQRRWMVIGYLLCAVQMGVTWLMGRLTLSPGPDKGKGE